MHTLMFRLHLLCSWEGWACVSWNALAMQRPTSEEPAFHLHLLTGLTEDSKLNKLIKNSAEPSNWGAKGRKRISSFGKYFGNLFNKDTCAPCPCTGLDKLLHMAKRHEWTLMIKPPPSWNLYWISLGSEFSFIIFFLESCDVVIHDPSPAMREDQTWIQAAESLQRLALPSVHESAVEVLVFRSTQLVFLTQILPPASPLALLNMAV